MKKIFLFVAAASLALGSCSSDDNGSGTGGKVKLTVDGTQKTYNHVVVTPQTVGTGADQYVELTVVATTSGTTASEAVSFTVEQEDVSANAVSDLFYTAAGDIFYDNGGVVSNVQTNTTHKLKGTFSGSVVSASGNVTKTITNGTFDISY